MLTCDKCKKQIWVMEAKHIPEGDLCASCYIDYLEVISYAEIRTLNAIKRWLGLPIHCCEYCGREGIIGKNLMEQGEGVVSCTDLTECEERIRKHGKQV